MIPQSDAQQRRQPSGTGHARSRRASALLLGTPLLLAACGDDGPSATACDPAAPDPCGEGRVCVAVGPDAAECRPACDLAAPDCPSGTVCVPVGGGEAACVAACEGDGECGPGWVCVPAGDRGMVCRPACEVAAATCDPGEVCQPLEGGGAACVPECSPEDDLSCLGETACEERTDGLHACYDPVRLVGRVFDLSDDAGIGDARVFAADETGAAATDVAISAADGAYELPVPVVREPADGSPAASGGTFTLRVAAQGYEPFPHGMRVALPIDAAALAEPDAAGWTVEIAATDVGLIPLPSPARERGSIAGRVLAASPGGVLVVATAGAPDPPLGWSDRSGEYVVFNADPGTYLVNGYKAGLQLGAESVIVGAGEHRTGVDLAEVAGTPTAAVSGSINIVNRDRCTGTSIVLVPETTFDETLVRGEVAPGLRAPPPGTPPDIDGPWSIAGVPDGRYVVLAAFENDGCVRDPDPGIAGTEIEHIAVPDPAEGREITLDEQFKVTGALRIIGPGATEPEAVTGAPTLAWSRDSSADEHHLVVYDAFGTEVWAPDPIPAEGSADPAVPYAGPDLEPGMYYQFRATSIRREGPISMTEDLLGVFFRPAE